MAVSKIAVINDGLSKNQARTGWLPHPAQAPDIDATESHIADITGVARYTSCGNWLALKMRIENVSQQRCRLVGADTAGVTINLWCTPRTPKKLSSLRGQSKT